MSVFKRSAAFLTAVGIAASCAACGYNTRSAMTVDGAEVPAGMYIYYLNAAYSQALSKVQENDAEVDTEDESALKAQIIEDGKDFMTWVQDEAVKECTEYAVLEKKFSELGLSFGEDVKSNLSMMMDYYWESSKDVMEKNGISEDSFRKIVTSSYTSDEIYKYYYAVGGQEGVTDDDLYNYYKDNNIRAEYITISLKDAEGNLLKSDGKKEMMDMAEEYRDRIEEALAEGGVKSAKEELAKVREDYNAYQEALTAEASEEDADGETEAETVEETTEETTAATTEADAEGETSADEETTEPETRTEEGGVDLVDAPNDSDEETTETTEETAATTDAASEETTEETSDETDAEDGEETTEAETEEETDGDSEDEDAEDEETVSDEDSDAEAAEEDEEEDPNANESIISVIHEEDYDDPNDIIYNPTEGVYKKLLSIEAKDYGKPYIVEEDENYYIVVRYDIEDRMVANDLWTETTKENVMYNLHSKDFQDMTDGWVAAASVQRNDAAFRRYDPFKLDFT